MQQEFMPHNEGSTEGQTAQWNNGYQGAYTGGSSSYEQEKLQPKQKGEVEFHLQWNPYAFILIGMLLSAIIFGLTFHWETWLVVVVCTVLTGGTIFSFRYRKTDGNRYSFPPFRNHFWH